MTTTRNKVINFHTTELNKYPTADGTLTGDRLIEKGEITINCSTGSEMINIVNTSNDIVVFKDWSATEQLVNNSKIKIKHLTFEGESGELPLDMWDDIISADLFTINSIYVYSYARTETTIHFDIITTYSDSNGHMSAMTLTFYDLTKDVDKIVWVAQKHVGNFLTEITQETGTNTDIVMSQNAVTTQLNGLQTSINDIKNNYQKKVVSVSSSETTKTIDSNTYYKWGTMTSLNISLNTNVDSSILNEYMFEFTSGSTPTTLSLPSSIKWLNGLSPIIEQNKTYQVSIINNLGIITMFK